MKTVLSRVGEASTPVSIGDADRYAEGVASRARRPTSCDDDDDDIYDDDIYETFTPVFCADDGGHVCYVISVPVHRLHMLVKSGSVRLARLFHGHKGRQREQDVRDRERIAEWKMELLSEQKPFLGGLTWNVRPDGGSKIEYIPRERTLKIAGFIDVPDSVRRHAALVEAYDAAINRGGNFDPRYRVSITVHHLGLEEEARLFAHLNQPRTAAV